VIDIKKPPPPVLPAYYRRRFSLELSFGQIYPIGEGAGEKLIKM
jgi:hypothetical protein